MNTAPTLADFEAWLATAQQRALDGTQATRGAAFIAHTDELIMVSGAINVLHRFKMAAFNRAEVSA